MAIDTIETYILNQIAMLDNNTITADDLVNKLLLKLKSDYNMDETYDLRQIITNIVSAYQNKAISSDDFISLFKETASLSTFTQQSVTSSYSSNNNSSSSHSNSNSISNSGSNSTSNSTSNSSGNSTSNSTSNSSSNFNSKNSSNSSSNTSQSNKDEDKKESDVVVDVDTDVVLDVSSKLAEIESKVTSAKIDVPAAAGSYDTGISGAVDTVKSEVNSAFDEIKGAMTEITQTASLLDENGNAITFEGETFDTISKIAYDIKQNSLAVEVTEKFFRDGGCTIDGDFAILNVNGKEYKYNMKKHRFYINGKDAFEQSVYFFVPSNATDYSKLNTYTCFIKKSSPDIEALMGQQSTNAVIARISKPGDQVHFTKYSETADLTKFMNAVAKTDRKNCQNIIAGDSAYGSHALQITAQNTDTYDTVYCINYAATVRGENAGGKRQQFESLADLQKLDNKDIYFISVSGDENFSHYFNGNNDYAHVTGYENSASITSEAYQNGYTYSGLRLICENCPNAKIHMVYNENDVTGSRSKNLIPLLKSLETEYSNYQYEPEYWYDFVNAGYNQRDHSAGLYIVNDVVKAPVTNYNSYTKSDTYRASGN